MKKEKELKLKDKDGNILKAQAFIIEDVHPAIGRILIVGDIKYKILDDRPDKRGGTFIKILTPEDEEFMEEYDREVEELSEKLIQKVDIKKMILEQIKTKTSQEIKTGLYILKKEEEGEKIETEHHRGCYHFKLHYKNQEFDFMSGSEILDNPDR